ncbi:MAG TPA: hypothetical protein VFH27_11380 [Longimicrobiaceae bacterium]|nr:hypothetical protein [Longimicrobiaceae bacterium]
MKKLRLNVEDVQVVSFTLDPEQPADGTVAAHSVTDDLSCADGSCFPVRCPREPASWSCGC